MTSTNERAVRARPRRGVRLRATWLGGLLVLIGASVAGMAFLTSPASAAECGGNQAIAQTPYSCTKERVIDGTTFSVVIDATDSTVTVHYSMDAPRPADTPIRVRSHVGISSTTAVPTEVSGVIPAGATTAVLSVPLSCGQIDVKAVFIGNGDSSGRVVAPYITNGTNCASVVTTTSTPPTTTPPTTTPPTTGPSTSAATTVPPTGPTTPTTTPSGAVTTVTVPTNATSIVPGPLPVTGRSSGSAVVAGVVLVAAGLVLLTVGTRRRRTL